ncbi:MAG TPA: YtxH domain-containing protein [Chitinophagaceae bacterium]|nr:YtxH domain-containing protein [Chitinophagaceae bacterium]
MKRVIGALSLLATGVVIGMLTAPDKGRNTRQKMSHKLDDMKNSLKKFKGSTSDELDELKETFKHEVTGLRDDMRQRVLELIKAAKTSQNNIKQEALT